MRRSCTLQAAEPTQVKTSASKVKSRRVLVNKVFSVRKLLLVCSVCFVMHCCWHQGCLSCIFTVPTHGSARFESRSNIGACVMVNLINRVCCKTTSECFFGAQLSCALGGLLHGTEWPGKPPCCMSLWGSAIMCPRQKLHDTASGLGNLLVRHDALKRPIGGFLVTVNAGTQRPVLSASSGKPFHLQSTITGSTLSNALSQKLKSFTKK